MFVDTHCHLDFPEFDQDRDEVVKRSCDNGVEYIVNIGSSLKGSEKSVELASRYDCVYAAVGIHPHEADKFKKVEQAIIEGLAKKNKVVAIGEIGLDFYKNYSQADNQRSLFILLVQLAKELGLPVVIHSRQAQDEILKILKEYMPLRAVVHCFSGDNNFLQACLDLGFLISFTCNITYKKAEDLRSLVRIAPLSRLLLETDAPFLAPEGFRGRRNEPLYVKHLAQEISRIKGIDLEDVAKVTTENAKSFFGIK